MALALLTPIAIEVAKSIGMGVITEGLDRLISGRNIFTGDGKHRRRKLKGGADPDPALVKTIEDLTLKHLTGEGKTRKKRTRKLKGSGWGDDAERVFSGVGNYLAQPFTDAYKELKNGRGKSGGAKKTSPWIERVKEYRKKHGCSYKEALIKLGKSNKK